MFGDERVQIVDADAVLVLGGDGDRDDVLSEHVEGVARHDRRLDLPGAHQPADDGALEQVAAELGEEAPAADLADAVTGASDALQPAGDGLGRLDLQDEVDGAHVDAELQRAGGHETGQLAGLQELLDVRALLARERAVMGAGDLARSGKGRIRIVGRIRSVGGDLGILARGELVQAQRDALGRAAVVDEDDRGGVFAHAAQQLGVDRGPDRATCGLAPGYGLERIGSRACDGIVGAGFGHRLDRDFDAEIEQGGGRRVEDRDLAAGADEEAPDLLQRALGRAEADALRAEYGPALAGGGRSTLSRARSGHEGIEALEREREVRAALGGGDGVDLVDDHRLDAREHRSRLRGEDQVERLRRRDQDVGRVAHHRGALALGGVARADGHGDVVGDADAAQGRAEVALDVVGERLQRRDVDDAGGGARRRGCPSGARPRLNSDLARGGSGRGAAETVERPQERGERLARAGGRRQQHVLAARDHGPRLRLGGRWGGEGRLEPRADSWIEAGQWHPERPG